MEMGLPMEVVLRKVGTWQQRSSVTEIKEFSDDQKKVAKVKKQLPAWARFLTLFVPLVSVVIGIVLVSNAVLPIAWYYISSIQDINQSLLAPIPASEVLDVLPVVISDIATSEVKAIENNIEGDAGPVVIANELDYTNLANWFSAEVPVGAVKAPSKQGNQDKPDDQPQTQAVQQVLEYSIDIPDLKIQDAVVKIGGTRLEKNLVQYPGTANPGDLGAPVVFGHSVLRQFYNPAKNNSRRYLSIFSTIMTLKKGAKIYLTAGGVKYTYIVQEKQEVKPEDVYILEQNYSARQLKLVTCVPEGTYLRRGVIIATLAPHE